MYGNSDGRESGMEVILEGKYKIPVLLEDNHLIAVVKPPNLPVQPDISGDRDLYTVIKDYIARKYGKPGNVFLGLVHRLDRPTGGVMVFARTSKAASRLSAQFSSHAADKRYYAVLQGEMKEETRMEDLLLPDERTGNMLVIQADEPGAKRAVLTSRPICAKDGLTLTEVELETGRKHQIRVQHAHAGFPLWGDARYGGGQPGMQIALWAHSLSFDHPTLKTRVTLTCPPPSDGIWRAFEGELAGRD